MKIYRCTVTLLEATFFSSREVSNTFYTEPLLGNYALSYALGLAQSPYFNPNTVLYDQHLPPLNDTGVYVSPGTMAGEVRFILRQFNASADAYWYGFARNIIVDRPNDAWVAVEGSSWYTYRADGSKRKAAPENRPQHGRIRMLASGNTAVAYVLSERPMALPRYIRLGKFMSKARVDVEEMAFETTDAARVDIPHLLNPVDLPPELTLHNFDVISVPPTPLIRNTQASGTFFKLRGSVYLPTGMRYGVGEAA